jgi:hypothetical protein
MRLSCTKLYSNQHHCVCVYFATSLTSCASLLDSRTHKPPFPPHTHTHICAPVCNIWCCCWPSSSVLQLQFGLVTNLTTAFPPQAAIFAMCLRPSQPTRISDDHLCLRSDDCSCCDCADDRFPFSNSRHFRPHSKYVSKCIVGQR